MIDPKSYYLKAEEDYYRLKDKLIYNKKDKEDLHELTKDICSKYLKCIIATHISESNIDENNILNSLSLKSLCSFISIEMPELEINYRKIFIIEDSSFSLYTDNLSNIKYNTGLLLNSASYCKEIAENYLIKLKLNEYKIQQNWDILRKRKMKIYKIEIEISSVSRVYT